MDPDSLGPLGFLSNLFSNPAPMSTTAPGGDGSAPAPAPAPGAPPTDTTMASALPTAPPNPNSPTFKGFLGALSAGVKPSAMQIQKPPPAPQIAMPSTHQMSTAATLAQVMAALNAKNQNPMGQPQS